MTTKHNLVVITVSVLIAAAIPVLYKVNKGIPMRYKTFHLDSGCGYEIMVNEKVLIHQENIPAIAEKKEFPTEVQAAEAAQLVISKLKNNKLPTLSYAEINQICTPIRNE